MAYSLNLLGLIHWFSMCSSEELEVTEAKKSEGKAWFKGLKNIKGIIVDFKIHLRKVYEVVCSGLKQN